VETEYLKLLYASAVYLKMCSRSYSSVLLLLRVQSRKLVKQKHN
jgi:hypothetical protein